MKRTWGMISLVAMALAAPATAQTMYRCEDGGRTIYSDKPCLNGTEVKQMAPNGNPTAEQLAKARMKERASEQRMITAARDERAAKGEARGAATGAAPSATGAKNAKCGSGAAANCAP